MKYQKCARRGCNEIFEPHAKGQKYCCEECRKLENARVQQERYRKTSGHCSVGELVKLGLTVYPIKENCFAWDKREKSCKILTTLECLYKPRCPFFKTKEQCERDAAVAKARLKRK